MDYREHHRLAQEAGACSFRPPMAPRGHVAMEHHFAVHMQALEEGVPPDRFSAWIGGEAWGPPDERLKPRPYVLRGSVTISTPTLAEILAAKGLPAEAAPAHVAEPQMADPDEDEEEERRLEVAEQAAIALGPANRDKRVRRAWVASLEVEYMPGQWSQTYSVEFRPRAGTWTVLDIRSSSDGDGTMAAFFDSLADAVDFVAGEISVHEGHTRGLQFRPVTADDRVELRRFVYRLRAQLWASE